MGLFDKVKHFAGGHGVTAKIVTVERQDPKSATFPIGDSVMKFNVEVQGDKEVTVLAHKFEVWAERKSETNPRLMLVATDVHDEKTDIIGGDVKWPYNLQPGSVIRDGCCISEVDLRNTLKKMDVSDPDSAIGDPSYRFFVKFIADVKGSPMDASAESNFKVVG
jgi:hypothetical protein